MIPWRAGLLLLLAAPACAPRQAPGGSDARPTARSCAARGAVLDHRGMFGLPVCVRAFADAGRSCTDKADCQGRCILDFAREGVSLATHPIGAEASGQCQRDDALFGCYAEILQGRVTQPICAD